MARLARVLDAVRQRSIDNARAGAEIYAVNREEDKLTSLGRTAVRLAVLRVWFTVALTHTLEQPGTSRRSGSTLSLTGPLAALSHIEKAYAGALRRQRH